jgi:hypothetical protein
METTRTLLMDILFTIKLQLVLVHQRVAQQVHYHVLSPLVLMVNNLIQVRSDSVVTHPDLLAEDGEYVQPGLHRCVAHQESNCVSKIKSADMSVDFILCHYSVIH